MNIYKISVKAFEKMDALLFQSMLQLVQKQLVATWQFEESANIVVIDAEQPEGKIFWENHPSAKITVLYAKQNIYNAQWFLQKPVRVQPLVQLLNEMATLQTSQELATRASPVIEAKPTEMSAMPLTANHSEPKVATAAAIKKPTLVSTISEASCFNPSHYLIGLLEQAVKTVQPKCLMSADRIPLYVLPQEQRCFTRPISKKLVLLPKSIYALPLEKIKSIDLSVESLRAEVKNQALSEYTIDTILWLTALHASQGRLIDNQSKQALVRLKQWPNFAILPHQPAQMNLAAFMLKKTADLSEVAEKTQLPLATVIDFFNACKVLGLVIEATQTETTIAKKDLSEQKRNLLKTILARLRPTSES